MALGMRSPLPSFDGAVQWVNGGEPSESELEGKPVFVHFWSTECYVCHDTAEQVATWRAKFGPMGLEFVAIHQPRWPDELDLAKATADALGPMKIAHRLGMDNELAIVGRFENQFVPAFYLFDRDHQLRHFQAGDKGHERIEAAIHRVLAEQPALTIER
ncbi:MAG: redoxin domain-containing protein [Candidatus Eremiobacteraeota bacterium]|nr:redoxin domain-containing protein [Candidatus Eremiobacteraeota bacterium]